MESQPPNPPNPPDPPDRAKNARMPDPREGSWQNLAAVRATESEMPKHHCDILLPEGGRVMFVGEAWAGKSVFAINLAAALAEGKDFLGFKIPQPRRVCYLNLEQPEPQFNNRLRLMSASRGTDPEAPLFIRTNRSFDFTRDRRALALEMRTFCPDVIFIDTMVEIATDFDENKSSDIARLFKLLDVVCPHSSTTLCLLHHMNKAAFTSDGGRADSRYRIRGSSAILAAVDNCLAIEHTGRSRARLSTVKLRNHTATEPVDFRIMPDFTVEIGGEPTSPEILGKILASMLRFQQPRKAEDIAATAATSRAQTFRALKELRTLGLAEPSADGWCLTQRGQSASPSIFEGP